MRVLQIHTRYRQSGGEDAVVESESGLLTAAGHTLEQLIWANPTSPLDTISKLSMAVWNPRAKRDISQVLREFRPDIAHVHNTWFATSPSILSALQQNHVPTVMTLHNYRITCGNGLLMRDGEPCELCVDGSAMNCLRYQCYRGPVGSAVAAASVGIHRSLNTWNENVDLFVVLTAFAREMFIRAGIDPGRLLIKPNFTNDPGPRPSVPSSSRTVLFVGRLSEEKGAADLLEAWTDACDGSGLSLSVVGDGPLAPELRERYPSVNWTGPLPINEVRRLMLGSRALAFPSRWYEGQPMVLLEAFSAGLPTLVVGKGGHVETARPLGPRWLVEDRRLLGEALAVMLDDGEVDRAGTQARSMYESDYSPEAAITALDTTYRAAIDRHEERSSGGVRS